MPRLLIYGDRTDIAERTANRYANWIAPWRGPRDEWPTPLQLNTIFDWTEWPFGHPNAGCQACAWAHLYGLAYYDPCFRRGVTGYDLRSTVNPRCSHRIQFESWEASETPFMPENGFVTGDRSSQEAIINLRQEREADDGDGERGCLCCITYLNEGGDYDPCNSYDPTEPNRYCAYYRWWEEEGSDNVQRRAELREAAERRRNPDYPDGYRSRRGRGTCTLRRIHNECPPSCPCRRGAARALTERLRRAREAEQRRLEWEAVTAASTISASTLRQTIDELRRASANVTTNVPFEWVVEHDDTDERNSWRVTYDEED